MSHWEVLPSLEKLASAHKARGPRLKLTPGAARCQRVLWGVFEH